MSRKPNIEDLRISSSSIDAFFQPAPRRTVASSPGRIRVSGLSQLAGFRLVAEDTLVRVSQQDFWTLGKDSDGFYVERLVEDGDGPVSGT